MQSNKITLDYVIAKPRGLINLDLYQAEKYESAVIVQQLIGTLVYYSNYGRYEPRIAESWNQVNDTTWKFKLKKNFRCENGENITTLSFKKSIERSMHLFGRKGSIPILNSLIGYQEFTAKNKNAINIEDISPIEGIEAFDEYLVFKFSRKVKSGLLQILSFSPFGYICSDNLQKRRMERANSTYFLRTI